VDEWPYILIWKPISANIKNHTYARKECSHMSYRVIQYQIAQDNLIYDYCDNNAHKAKLLYNAALFRIRQIFTGWDKDSRTDNEKEVFAEVDLLQQTYPSVKVKRVISYCHLEKLMRVTNNPDFFAGLPMQTAQSVIKHAVTDFSNWVLLIRMLYYITQAMVLI